MGLPSEVVWGMTLRQLDLLLARHVGHIRRADRRAGEIVAMLYNVNRNSTKDPKGWSWLDVFPEHRPPRIVQTEEQMYQTMLLWAKSTRRS